MQGDLPLDVFSAKLGLVEGSEVGEILEEVSQASDVVQMAEPPDHTQYVRRH